MQHHSLVDTLMTLPIFQAEWVLWFLIALSVLSVMVIAERGLFFVRRRSDIGSVHDALVDFLDRGDLAGAVDFLTPLDTLPTNVVRHGLRDAALGPDSVEDLLAGRLTSEKTRYERRLNILATIGSNAPFIGLFGTVLGIIRAFRDLALDSADASAAAMAGVSEALVATAVGLVVAIPAVVAFNFFKSRIQVQVSDAQLLSRTVLAHLKGA